MRWIVGSSTVNDAQGNSTISSVLWTRDDSVIDLGTLGMKAPLGGPGGLAADSTATPAIRAKFLAGFHVDSVPGRR
jgi:hypothetical protein